MLCFWNFFVTIFNNVSLNNKLESFDIINATEKMVSQMRNIFENKWNFGNNIRKIPQIKYLTKNNLTKYH